MLSDVAICLVSYVQGHEESSLSNGQDQPGAGVWTDHSGTRDGRASSEDNPEGHNHTAQGQSLLTEVWPTRPLQLFAGLSPDLL